MSSGHQILDAQREQWQSTFRANPDMYGTDPSEPGAHASGLFAREQVRDLLKLGAGQGRDTLAFLRAGVTVTALDYAAGALTHLQQAATDAGLAGRLTTAVHDVRKPLPLPDGGFDAVYSHMLFNMALTTAELETLTGEVRRTLRPAGLHFHTVRHTGDTHYGAGTSHGDNMFENGGFIVHFFDRALVDRLATGFTLLDLTPFEEGGLPRRLWRITLRREDARSTPHSVSGGPTLSLRSQSTWAPLREVNNTWRRRRCTCATPTRAGRFLLPMACPGVADSRCPISEDTEQGNLHSEYPRKPIRYQPLLFGVTREASGCHACKTFTLRNGRVQARGVVGQTRHSRHTHELSPPEQDITGSAVLKMKDATCS